MVEEVKTGNRIVVTIKQKNLKGDGSDPRLGTDGTVETAPTASKEEVLRGTPTISFPIDNDPQETTELGDRIVQKWTGAFKIDGRLERWMVNSDLWGASLGKADYTATGVITYKPSQEFVKFDIMIYYVTEDYDISNSAVPTAAEWTQKITLSNCTFGSYEATVEANARVKETVTFFAETMMVETKW